jgi:hypothetical protein
MVGFVGIGDVVNTGVCQLVTDAGQLNCELCDNK